MPKQIAGDTLELRFLQIARFPSVDSLRDGVLDHAVVSQTIPTVSGGMYLIFVGQRH